MLKGLWTVGLKVKNLEEEIKFHRQLGNEIVLDEEIPVERDIYRVVLVKMADKYLHLAEKTVYEKCLDNPLPYGVVHLVYISDDFDRDIEMFEGAGATHIIPPLDVSAGFGERRVAFLLTPNGWVCEVAKIYRHAVPEVVVMSGVVDGSQKASPT